MTTWGVRTDQPDLDHVENGFVAIGWDEVGDLSKIGQDKDLMKQRLIEARPNAKPGAIPVWAGVLLRFAFEMEIGDHVIYPNKLDSTLNFGQVTGDYYFEENAPVHRNRRQVKWLEVGVPRAEFSKSARYELGSLVTLFKVKNHEREFIDFLQGMPVPPTSPGEVAAEEAAESAEEELNSERIETYTRDFIIETLHKELDGYKFEYFVAHLLKAMGYKTRVTQASGDGGIDVIAHHDSLGLEPPIIKVQCKRTVGSSGAPDVQKLMGTLARDGELGLFVTLGAYSKDAVHLENSRQDLRLISGNDLVDLIFEHYAKFDSEWKALLPMRSLYVVDREPEAG